MNARKDDLDDVLKLVSFFKYMKAINDAFFYDIQVDNANVIKKHFLVQCKLPRSIARLW